MLNGTTVDNIVVGGAAWLTGNQIKRGDIIVEVSARGWMLASFFPYIHKHMNEVLGCNG